MAGEFDFGDLSESSLLNVENEEDVSGAFILFSGIFFVFLRSDLHLLILLRRPIFLIYQVIYFVV